MKQGEKSFQQPVIPIFLPVSSSTDNLAAILELLTLDVQESDAKEAELDEKSENVQVPADVIEERRLFKQSVVEAVEECRQLRVEIEKDQAKARSLLDAIGSLSEYRAIRCKSEPSAIISNTEHPTKPRLVNQAPSHAQPEKSDYHALSHSATKVRRGLFEAKGRVRSMIDAFNGKNEVSPVIPRIHHKRMVTSIANTINRQSDAQHPAKPQPPVVPKKTGLTCRPLPLPPYPDPWTLSKPAKLQILSRHQYHRLVPVPEESDSKSLVLANSVTNTVILRRAKAIKVRNLNAFHCPVRQPRFGLKRKVLAPPVPRHSTPPVAVPCSKFADLGRRRVSELEWRFVI